MSLKKKLAELFLMPREEFGDECMLTLAGTGGIRLLGRHRLILCTSEELRFLVLSDGKRRILSVAGRELHLTETGADRTIAAGCVEYVRFLS